MQRIVLASLATLIGTTSFIISSSRAEKMKPTSGEINNERPMFPACFQSTPLVAV